MMRTGRREQGNEFINLQNYLEAQAREISLSLVQVLLLSQRFIHEALKFLAIFEHLSKWFI